MGTAWFNEDPDIRTEFKNLNIITPHIEAAYFAKKVVTRQENDELSVSFERIPRTFLGRDVYVIIKMANTSQVRDETFKLSLLTENDILTGTTDEVLALEETDQSDSNAYTAQLGNDPEVLRNPNLNSPSIQPIYNNLDDFKDTLIYKIPLRPRDRATFDTWATNIHEKFGLANLQFRLESGAYMLNKEVPFFSSMFCAAKSLTFEPRIDTSTSWANTFTLRNGVVYEIYHPDNVFNPFEDEYTVTLGINGTGGTEGFNKRIGKIDNSRSDEATYFYHDQDDNEHEVCTCEISSVRPRTNGNKDAQNVWAGVLIPLADTPSEEAPTGGDATRHYTFEDGTITTQGTTTGISYVTYRLMNQNQDVTIDLIRMPNELDLTFEAGESRNDPNSQTASPPTNNDINISYDFHNSQRRFCNPSCFAAFIGVLAETSLTSIESTGMCFGNATSYPSVSHPNGDSIDTRYIGTGRTRNLWDTRPTFDADAETLFATAFVNWGFTQVIAGNHSRYDDLETVVHLRNGHHNDHLHSGNFDEDFIHVINE